MSSIRRQLLLWLLSGLLIGVMIAALGIYYNARKEANELFDYQIRQMALSFPEGALLRTVPPGTQHIEQELVIQVWSLEGNALYFSDPRTGLPQGLGLGFTTIATNLGAWRVFNAVIGDRIIQIAQPMSVRSRLAADVALRTVWPLLLLFPVLGVLIWLTVSRGLRPLDQVAAAVSERSPAALQSLPEAHLPEEVRPLVHALNDLLSRLGGALDTQRSFIADAAHELRSPLTALHLQVQLAERAHVDAERSAAFAQLKAGLQRATHLVAQLLTLARQDPSVIARPPAEVDLSEIARLVIAERAAIAEQKRIDLGILHSEPVKIMGDAEGLRILLGNLVDNAISYTPDSGKIDVSVVLRDGRPLMTVADTGPGIPAQDRKRAFDRFYRREGPGAGEESGTREGLATSGSGLGLAIVKNIADRHRALVELGERKDGTGLPRGSGLVVTVRFEAAGPG